MAKKQKPPEYLKKKDVPKVPEDKLMELRTLVAQARDIDLQAKQVEEQRKELVHQLNELNRNTIPTLMDGIGVPAITLEADGNYPGVEAKVQPYYKANIAANWPDEKKEAAFKWLDDNGHGDLIKTQYVISLPREDREKAKEVEKALNKMKVPFEKTLAVPWSTLTAWLKEQVEKHGVLPPLDLIGGDVGRVVKLTEKKEK